MITCVSYFLRLQRPTNKPQGIAVTFFIKPLRSCFLNTHPGFFGGFLGRQGYLVCVEVCLLSELNEKAGWWIYLGYFKKLLPCHRVAKCSANSFPIMLSVCLVNWPQMPGFYKEKYIFSAAVCLASPGSGVIIYLICSPNKLLTLIFVSQHVFSWFVIESQSGQIVVELELPLLLYSQCLLDFSSPLHSENHWVPFQKTPGAFTTFQIFFLFLSLSFFLDTCKHALKCPTWLNSTPARII